MTRMRRSLKRPREVWHDGNHRVDRGGGRASGSGGGRISIWEKEAVRTRSAAGGACSGEVAGAPVSGAGVKTNNSRKSRHVRAGSLAKYTGNAASGAG